MKFLNFNFSGLIDLGFLSSMCFIFLEVPTTDFDLNQIIKTGVASIGIAAGYFFYHELKRTTAMIINILEKQIEQKNADLEKKDLLIRDLQNKLIEKNA